MILLLMVLRWAGLRANLPATAAGPIPGWAGAIIAVITCVLTRQIDELTVAADQVSSR